MNSIEIVQVHVDHVDTIIQIGKESAFDAHRESCSKEILDAFIEIITIQRRLVPKL